MVRKGIKNDKNMESEESMQCSKCNSEQGELKSGVSSKTGKPWKGWKCSECNEMTWLRSTGTKEQPKENKFVSPQQMAEKLDKQENAEIFPPKTGVNTKDKMIGLSYCNNLYIELFKFIGGDLELMPTVYNRAIETIKAGNTNLLKE